MGGASSVSISQKIEGEDAGLEAKMFYERYPVDFVLGNGSFSTVYRAIDSRASSFTSSPSHVAVKRITLPKSSSSIYLDSSPSDIIRASLNELNAFHTVKSHPYIVKLHCAFRYLNTCSIVMDYLEGGDLRNLMKTQGMLEEKDVTYILGCVGSALHHMHLQGIIHRDVKPENIGLSMNGRPYLTDFGISLISDTLNPIPIGESSSGTLPYLAPEVLTPSKYHSSQSDFWSLGVTGYELYFGHRPFIRHVPIKVMQFVANEYTDMWKQLRSQSTPTSHSQPQPTPRHQSHSNLNFESFYYDTYHLVDRTIPFPHLDLHMQVDGTVPSCLITPIPCQRKGSMIAISEEFSSLLSGLLDIRPPQRFGNTSNYSEFSYHSCFIKYDYFPSTIASSTLESPLISRIQAPCLSLNHGFDVTGNIWKDTLIGEKYSTEIELLLGDYSYLPSSSSKDNSGFENFSVGVNMVKEFKPLPLQTLIISSVGSIGSFSGSSDQHDQN